MKLRCPNPKCLTALESSLKTVPIIRKGTYFRKSDSRFVKRFFCKSCQKNFSSVTGKAHIFQKRRRITPILSKLLTSGVTQRRCAILLKVNRKTVVRRLRYLSKIEASLHQDWLKQTYQRNPMNYIQFDDLETAEHTKCKPLSVALAVDPRTRKILGFQVNRMPAKGHLAKISLRKYGYRKDERSKGWDLMMKELKPFVNEGAIFRSDSNPHYPRFLFKHHPHAIHETSIGGRGSITGQGELKKLKFDPLFALNHTCAMLRANLNRLFRKTWSTTKTIQGLIDHLSIYVGYHNRVLTH